MVIGIQDNLNATLDKVNQALKQGYHRVKFKVSPATNLGLLKEVVQEIPPQVSVAVDCNGSFNKTHSQQLKYLDSLQLEFIEQPCKNSSKPVLKTPICLDESIQTIDDLMRTPLSDVQMVNIKPAKVGGFSDAFKILE